MTGQVFNDAQYESLASIVFREGYPGFRPKVFESPNGDGNVDLTKRYAHVAAKYLLGCPASRDNDTLQDALCEAHKLAQRVANALDVPWRFWPSRKYSTLRVLDYPPGAGSHRHTDMDLFTVMCYRDQLKCFVAHDAGPPACGGYSQMASALDQRDRLLNARKLNAQLHIGELGEAIGLGPATPHEVIAGARPQHSIVYFAIPDHAAVLPSGITVGEWLEERLGRSRVGA